MMKDTFVTCGCSWLFSHQLINVCVLMFLRRVSCTASVFTFCEL